ncbi:hypothetical protein JHW43_002568 [Diplocarpon mali]|nr:hypothetical protein JHW43_002568 [Diplocarpon mali]
MTPLLLIRRNLGKFEQIGFGLAHAAKSTLVSGACVDLDVPEAKVSPAPAAMPGLSMTSQAVLYFAAHANERTSATVPSHNNGATGHFFDHARVAARGPQVDIGRLATRFALPVPRSYAGIAGPLAAAESRYRGADHNNGQLCWCCLVSFLVGPRKSNLISIPTSVHVSLDASAIIDRDTPRSFHHRTVLYRNSDS